MFRYISTLLFLLLGSHHYQDTRILSSIPENRQQSTFKSTSQPLYYRAFLSSIAFEFKRRIILSDRIKNDIEYHNVFDGKEAVVKKIKNKKLVEKYCYCVLKNIYIYMYRIN